MDRPTEAGATKAFGKAKPNRKIAYIAFAGELDGRVIYEIWYMEGGEYNVSFVTHDRTTGYGFVDSISALIHETAENRRAIQDRLESLREGRVRLYVASVAFLISLAAVLYIAIDGESDAQSVSIVAAVIGVVSSGALYFFGAWVPGGIFRFKPKSSESSDR